MDMSLGDLIASLGGGLTGAVIAGLAWANWIQFKRNNDLQDKMLKMAEDRVREGRELLTATNQATNANAAVMVKVVDRLEGR